MAKGWDENVGANPYTWTPEDGKSGGSGGAEGGVWGSDTRKDRNYRPKELSHSGSASRSRITPPRRNPSPHRRDHRQSSDSRSRPSASPASKTYNSNSNSRSSHKESRYGQGQSPGHRGSRYEPSESPRHQARSNGFKSDKRKENRKGKDTNHRDNGDRKSSWDSRKSPDRREVRRTPYERVMTPDRRRVSPPRQRRAPSPLPPSRHRSPPHINSSFVKSSFEPKSSFVDEKKVNPPVKYGFQSDSSVTLRRAILPQPPLTSASCTVPVVPIHRPVRLNTFAFPSIGSVSAPPQVNPAPTPPRPKNAFTSWGTRID